MSQCTMAKLWRRWWCMTIIFLNHCCHLCVFKQFSNFLFSLLKVRLADFFDDRDVSDHHGRGDEASIFWLEALRACIVNHARDCATTIVSKSNLQAWQKCETFSCLRDSDSKAIFLKICTQMSERFYAGETFPSKRIFSRKNVIQICLVLITLIPT